MRVIVPALYAHKIARPHMLCTSLLPDIFCVVALNSGHSKLIVLCERDSSWLTTQPLTVQLQQETTNGKITEHLSGSRKFGRKGSHYVRFPADRTRDETHSRKRYISKQKCSHRLLEDSVFNTGTPGNLKELRVHLTQPDPQEDVGLFFYGIIQRNIRIIRI